MPPPEENIRTISGVLYGTVAISERMFERTASSMDIIREAVRAGHIDHVTGSWKDPSSDVLYITGPLTKERTDYLRRRAIVEGMQSHATESSGHLLVGHSRGRFIDLKRKKE